MGEGGKPWRSSVVHLSKFCSFSVAANVGVKGNCINCIDPSKEEPMPWSIFDLSNGSVTAHVLLRLLLILCLC